MQLTDQDIAEFQEAYAEAFCESIGTAEVREMASRVLRLYELLKRARSERRRGLEVLP